MKKIVYLIILLCTIYDSNAQITYEASYSSQPLILYFNHMSPKWMTRPTQNQVNLYNLDHSLYASINIPAQPAYFGIAYITEDLFDTDSTNLEYLISSVMNASTFFVKIYRQNGTLLFQRDSATVTFSAILANNDYRSNIVPTDSGTKMFLGIYTPYYNHSEVYSLPGVLPCPMVCGNISSEGSFPVQIEEAVQKNFNNPYPNPTSSQIRIPYQLPQGEPKGEIVFYDLAGVEVKRYKVDNAFTELILTTSDLAAGSYYYQLQTAHTKSEGKKLLVVK